MNLLYLIFFVWTFIILFCGTLVNCCSHLPFVPDILKHSFKFGKSSEKHSFKLVNALSIPKRWFVHFYIVGSLVVTLLVYYLGRFYLTCHSAPSNLINFINLITTLSTLNNNDIVIANGFNIALSLVLITLQIYRRLYENLFVSHFSCSTMNILHYIVGLVHYIAIVLILISHSPGFTHQEANCRLVLKVDAIQYVGMLIYCIGFVLQHDSLRRLAALRSHGKKSVEKYMMPNGGMFEMISCPHMFGEVLVYLGILFVLYFDHLGWTLVFIWVLSNQTQVAVMNHHWYKETFKDYPKERRAIIPYIL